MDGCVHVRTCWCVIRVCVCVCVWVCVCVCLWICLCSTYTDNKCHTWLHDLVRPLLISHIYLCLSHTHRYTFEMAPVYSLMEGQVLQKMRELAGWHKGDGIFSPGGSISNLYALMAARYRLFPETKTKGVSHLPPMAMFVSDQVCW